MDSDLREVADRQVREAYRRLREKEEEKKRLTGHVLSLVGTGKEANIEPLRKDVLSLAELSNIDHEDTDRNLLNRSLKEAINMKPSIYGDVTCNIPLGGHYISISYSPLEVMIDI